MRAFGPGQVKNHLSISIIFRCWIAALCRMCSRQARPPGQTVPTKVNQGGEDIKLNGETTFAHNVRGVASLDYLSSFAFRLAFTDNFSQAVNSEVKSTAFVSKSIQGFSMNAFGSRYQNFQSSTNNDDAISILHIPGVEFNNVDQRIPGTPLYGTYDLAVEGLRRTELNFSTLGLVGRFGASPELSLPLHFGGWLFRPSAQLNDTFYTQQQAPQAIPGQNIARGSTNPKSTESEGHWRKS